MPQITMGFAAALIALGIYALFASASGSPTVLIPVVFGVVLAFCGVLALQDAWRRHAMHVAASLALLGSLGSLWRAIPTALDSPQLGLATTVQLIMAGLLLMFLGLAIRSFMVARDARRGLSG